jgi:uncharacterized membrane protein
VSFAVSKDVPQTYSVEVAGQSESFTVLRPAAFSPSNLTVNAAQVAAGEPVTISVQVTNTGEVQGGYTATLMVNGQMEAIQEVTLGGGESTSLSFTVSEGVPQTYDVEVQGLTASFSVAQPVSWALVGAIIAATIALAGIVYYFVGRRRKLAH